MTTEEIKERFDTAKVRDGRRIGLVYFDKEKDMLVGHVLGFNGSVAMKWDKHTGKSILTPNSDLLFA